MTITTPPQPTRRSPFCIYQTHCGSKAVLGRPIPGDGVVDTPIMCTTCKAYGVLSERTDTPTRDKETR